MFTNLNPLDRPTAILEIVIMLMGAALIGFCIAWFARKPRKAGTSTAPVPTEKANAKPDPQLKKLEQSVQTLNAEKTAL